MDRSPSQTYRPSFFFRQFLRRSLLSSSLGYGALALALFAASAQGSISLAPIPLGGLVTPGSAMSCALVGNQCVVAAGVAGLLVIDVSDISRPRQVGACDTGGDARVVTTVGHMAYVGDGIGGFHVIDISNPQAPRITGTDPRLTHTRGLVVSGNFAYVANGNLSIIDIRNPQEPKIVGSYSIPIEGEDVPLFSISSVAISGHHAVCGAGPLIWTFDITDPTLPRLAGEVLIGGGQIESLVVQGNRVFAAADGGGLRVADISDPIHPKMVEHHGIPGFSKSISQTDGRVFVSTDFPAIYFFELSPAGAATLVGRYPSQSAVGSMVTAGHIGYAAAGTNGLQLIDLVPANPSSDAALTSATALAVRGPQALVGQLGSSSLVGSLSLVDVSDPDHLRSLAFLSTGLGYPISIAMAPHVACYLNLYGDIADGGVFRTVDLSDPTQLRHLGSYDLDYSALEVVMYGTFALVGDLDAGLIVMDVSDPRNPRKRGALDVEGGVKSLAVADNIAFLACGTAGLQVVDLHDPDHPIRLGGFPTLGDAIRVRCAGDVCILGELYGQVTVLDISDPRLPKPLGSYHLRGYLRELEISGNTLLLTGYPGGMEWIDISNPSSPLRISGNSILDPGEIIFEGGRIYLSGYGATGVSSLSPPGRIQWELPYGLESGRVALRLYGRPGERLQLERSPDLEVWNPWQLVELGQRPTLVPDPLPDDDLDQGFIRAKAVAGEEARPSSAPRFWPGMESE